MILLWAIGSIFYAIYAIILGLSIPLIVQPNLFILFSNVCLAQCIYYDGEWGVRKLVKAKSKTIGLGAFLALGAVTALGQWGMVIALRVSFNGLDLQ